MTEGQIKRIEQKLAKIATEQAAKNYPPIKTWAEPYEGAPRPDDFTEDFDGQILVIARSFISYEQFEEYEREKEPNHA